LLGGVTCLAQTPEALVEQARAEPVGGRTASLIYSVQDHDVWSLTSVFSQPFTQPVALAPSVPKRWVLRRQFGQGDAFSIQRAPQWADSASCPQIESLLHALTVLSTPSFGIPGITPAEPRDDVQPRPIPVHGLGFTFWGTGLEPEGGMVWMRIRAFGNGLAHWGRDAERDLSGCWRETAPTV
jgi:hypothetical protein